MANEREKKLIEEVEIAQAKLRDTIEESKRLAASTDVLIANVKHGVGNENLCPSKPDAV